MLTDNIAGYGCGPTSMSIAVSALTRETADLIEMAELACENGGWCSKSGSYHSLIPNAAKAWGLPAEGCTASEPQRILDALADGKLVAALMLKGHFTHRWALHRPAGRAGRKDPGSRPRQLQPKPEGMGSLHHSERGQPPGRRGRAVLDHRVDLGHTMPKISIFAFSLHIIKKTGNSIFVSKDNFGNKYHILPKLS